MQGKCREIRGVFGTREFAEETDSRNSSLSNPHLPSSDFHTERKAVLRWHGRLAHVGTPGKSPENPGPADTTRKCRPFTDGTPVPPLDHPHFCRMGDFPASPSNDNFTIRGQ